MPWSFRNWMLCNVLASVGICICTMIILFIIQWRFPRSFYGIVARLFGIKRYVIDVGHNAILNNSEVPSSHEKHRDIRRFISNIIDDDAKGGNTSAVITDVTTLNAQPIVLQSANKITTWPSPNNVVDIIDDEEINNNPNLKYQSERNSQYMFVRSNVKKRNFRQVVNSVTMKSNQQKSVSVESGTSSVEPYTAVNVPEDHPAHPAYQRVVLDVYDKYLPLRKKRNRFLILMLSSIIIATVIVAFCEGCILASVTVYQDSQCPSYGDMECYHGSNETYFQCKLGNDIEFPLIGSSATCFRWIVVDQSPSSVLTQIGVCAGLLTTFGSVAEVFLRVLLYAYQQRRGVANGMRRVLEKTVGINNATQPFCLCCVKFPIRVSPPNFGLYRYPIVVCLTIAGYIIAAVLTVLAYIPLIYFRANVTSFTYIVLSSTALLCFFTMVWVVWEVDEICRVLPGGCMTIKELLQKPAFKNAKLLLSIKDPEKTKECLGELGFQEKEEEPKNKCAETNHETQLDGKRSASRSDLWKRISRLNGENQKKLSKEEIKLLREITNFSEKDIEEWHAGFLHDCPDGELTEERFIEICEKFFMKGQRARSFCKYFFQLFDEDKNWKINFAEFLIAIAPNTQGEWKARLNLAFEMYDLSHPSGIDKKELIMWIKAMYDVADMPSRGRMGNHDPKKSADEIMKLFDKDDDNKLSKDEFIEGCRKHPKLMTFLVPSHQNNPPQN